MTAESESSVIVTSTASPEVIRSALTASELEVSHVSVDGHNVRATNGSQLKYRIFGAYIPIGRKNIPADILVAPVEGQPDKRRISVRPDTRMYLFTLPAHHRAVRQLAGSVASVVSATA